MEILGTTTFHVTHDPKEQARKVAEEAAEAMEAIKAWADAPDSEPEEKERLRIRAEDELADAVTAALNAYDLMETDYMGVYEAMKRCRLRNEARGRYEARAQAVQPAQDLVRCAECRHSQGDDPVWCNKPFMVGGSYGSASEKRLRPRVTPDFFCKDGKRKGGR